MLSIDKTLHIDMETDLVNPLLFNSFPPQVLFQEIPDEISLAFTITGCPLQCRGCHSTDTWDPRTGCALSNSLYRDYLKRYGNMISCVLFFGGEWHLNALQDKLLIARKMGLKTCLYTGLDCVPERIHPHLNYLKTGPWRRALGGLESTTTNQRLIELSTGNLLNYRFQKDHQHAAA